MKDGDCFRYDAWEGKCTATIINGILKVYRTDKGKETKQYSFQCQSAQDTRELLAGFHIQVVWNGDEIRKMKLHEKYGFSVLNGESWSHFTRIPEKEEKEVSA